jgi:hypothetical protein
MITRHVFLAKIFYLCFGNGPLMSIIKTGFFIPNFEFIPYFFNFIENVKHFFLLQNRISNKHLL